MIGEAENAGVETRAGELAPAEIYGSSISSQQLLPVDIRAQHDSTSPMDIVPCTPVVNGSLRRSVAVNEELPSWLPEGWSMETRIRTSGMTAGTKDRYYYDPESHRRFRSKKEVLRFLEEKEQEKAHSVPDANLMGSSFLKQGASASKPEHTSGLDSVNQEAAGGSSANVSVKVKRKRAKSESDTNLMPSIFPEQEGSASKRQHALSLDSVNKQVESSISTNSSAKVSIPVFGNEVLPMGSKTAMEQGTSMETDASKQEYIGMEEVGAGSSWSNSLRITANQSVKTRVRKERLLGSCELLEILGRELCRKALVGDLNIETPQSALRISNKVHTRADWTHERDDFLIEQLLEQRREGHLAETGYGKMVWQTIVKIYNEKFGLQCNEQQMKSRLNILKRQYMTLKSLLQEVGFHWNEVSFVVTAADDVWDQYILKHPDVKPFRHNSFPLHDKLCRIFEGSYTKGRKQPSTGHSNPSKDHASVIGFDNSVKSHPRIIQTTLESVDSMTEKLGEWCNPTSNFMSQESTATMVAAQPFSKGRKDRVNSKQEIIPRDSSCDKGQTSVNDGRKVDSGKNQVLQSMQLNGLKQAPNVKDDSYETCLIILNELQGLDLDEILIALELLKDDMDRVVFVSLRGELQIKWLKEKCRKHKCRL